MRFDLAASNAHCECDTFRITSYVNEVLPAPCSWGLLTYIRWAFFLPILPPPHPTLHNSPQKSGIMESSSDFDTSDDGYVTPRDHRARTPPAVDMSEHLLDVVQKIRLMEDQFRLIQDERDHLKREVARLVLTSNSIRNRKDRLVGEVVQLKWTRKSWR